MIVAHELNAQGIRVFPCKLDKKPAVLHWKEPIDIASCHWPSDMVGVPIPNGIIILDLDTYKGITRQDVEQTLGCQLPWDQALIQTTPQGGQHYAFTASWPVRFGRQLAGLKGLDTRTPGKGYICTGPGYSTHGLGLYSFAYPQGLPPLPDECRPVLELITPEVPAIPSARTDTELNVEDVRAALRHLDPSCTRIEWVNRGIELRSGFADDEDTGLALFDEWSRGDLWPAGQPENYVAEDMVPQWGSFKPEGARRIGSLFYDAMASGWIPSPQFDTALAFGADAGSQTSYLAVLNRIKESGSDSTQTEIIVGEIKVSGCNGLQIDLLTAELFNALKAAGLYNKPLGDRIKRSLAPLQSVAAAVLLADVLDLRDLPLQPLSRPSSNHGTNAENIIREVFGNRVEEVENEIRFWCGNSWQSIDDDMMGRVVNAALRPDKHSLSNINGTKAVMRYNVHKALERSRDKRIYFKNCIFDCVSGSVDPHERHNYNIGTLTVDYDPQAAAPVWFEFLTSIFGGLPDSDQRYALLQETLGWGLLRHSLGIQKVIVFDGASRGGKSMILGCLQEIVGPYSSSIAAFTHLGDGKTQGVFRGRDICFDLEATRPDRSSISQATGFLKAMSANDLVSIQLLNTQTPWHGRLNCKYMIACNGLPKMIDDSGATSERFMILEFVRSFAENPDYQLMDKLRNELQGIAMWALAGAQRLIANGGKFTQPESTIEAFSHMKESNQPLLEFIDEHLLLETGAMAHYKDMFDRYRQFCIDNGIKLGTKNAFAKSLRQTLGEKAAHKRAFRLGGGSPTSGLVGVGLKTPFDTPSLQAIK